MPNLGHKVTKSYSLRKYCDKSVLILKKFVTLVICNDYTLHLANYNTKTYF